MVKVKQISVQNATCKQNFMKNIEPNSGTLKKAEPIYKHKDYSFYLLTLGVHACSEGYCSCPVCVCLSVRSILLPRASRPRNIGMYVFTVTWKNFYNCDFFAKNASFRSNGVICLPQMPPTTLNPQNDGYQRNQLKVGKPLKVAILIENGSFKSYGTFAYILFAHVRNIHMRRYILVHMDTN